MEEYENKYNPLVSVIILAYNNVEYLQQAIDSVIQQNYSSIEIIVSDDGSPNFEEEIVQKYINEKKSNNIENILINKNTGNMGTVKHANKMISLAKGDIIKLLAADDVLYSSNVLDKYVQCFTDTKVNIVLAKWEIYDHTLNSSIRVAPNNHCIRMIKDMDPNQLYEALITNNFVGGVGICIRKSFIRRIGYFDERYFLTEDWPTWLKVLRNHERIYFLDTIAVKYRLGGVSNNKNTQASQFLIQDLVKMIETEVFPYINNLKKIKQREVKFIYNKAKMWSRYNRVSQGILILKYIDIIVVRKLKSIIEYIRRK